jgi:hypothetical protein
MLGAAIASDNEMSDGIKLASGESIRAICQYVDAGFGVGCGLCDLRVR